MPGLYVGSGYDLAGEIADYPAGSAAYWFRKRLDTQPRAELTHITQATPQVAVAVLLAAEAIGGIRILRCRAAHLVAERWVAIEHRESDIPLRPARAARAVSAALRWPGRLRWSAPPPS